MRNEFGADIRAFLLPLLSFQALLFVALKLFCKALFLLTLASFGLQPLFLFALASFSLQPFFLLAFTT